jgi:phage recombination protein Bet
MTTQPLANVTQPARVSLLAAMASKYSMEPETFKQVIKQTVMPASATNEQMAAFLLVAHEYDLNPITKEIYAFPAKGGGITPVVGIDGWINLAQRRSEFDGMEHEWEIDAKGECTACTCKIYRKDRTRPVVVTEFMAECKRATDPWRLHPRRMLRHKATFQAIRYAFGFAGIKDEDDAEVIYTQATVIEHAPVNSQPARARLMAQAATPTDPSPTHEEESAIPDWPQPDPETGELLDVRGLPWIEAAHSVGKTCNDDGSWRRKRGVDTEIVARLEAAAMAKLEPKPPVSAALEPDETTLPADVSEFDKIRSGIKAAGDQQEMAEKHIERTGEDATFDDLLLLYLEQVTPTKRDPRRDRFSAKALFPMFTGRNLTNIGAAEVRGYIASRTAAGIAPSTLNKEIALVSAALNWSRRELEWDVANPWESRRQKEPTGRDRWLTEAEAARLLNAAESPRRTLRYPWLHDFIRLGLNSGMRPGEMLWLEWKRVDLRGACITFEAARPGEDKTGQKNGKPGRVPLNREAREAILARARFRAEHCPASPWVFCRKDG